MALRFTQPLTEMSTWRSFWGKERPAPKAYNLTAICVPIVQNNVGFLTSRNPIGLNCQFTFLLYTILKFTFFGLSVTYIFYRHDQ
jgi:hypothetical protein